jgi:hypothetical protein
MTLKVAFNRNRIKIFFSLKTKIIENEQRGWKWINTDGEKYLLLELND